MVHLFWVVFFTVRLGARLQGVFGVLQKKMSHVFELYRRCLLQWATTPSLKRKQLLETEGDIKLHAVKNLNLHKFFQHRKNNY